MNRLIRSIYDLNEVARLMRERAVNAKLPASIFNLVGAHRYMREVKNIRTTDKGQTCA